MSVKFYKDDNAERGIVDAIINRALVDFIEKRNFEIRFYGIRLARNRFVGFMAFIPKRAVKGGHENERNQDI